MIGFPCGAPDGGRRARLRRPGSRRLRVRTWPRAFCHLLPVGRDGYLERPKPRAARPCHLGLSLFLDEEEGYTTVAVACALLVSFALTLSLAQVQWIGARSADVQEVADAAALSGTQVVRAYTLIAEIEDACVLSLGLGGLFVMGAGLITCAVPGMAPAGLKVVDAGGKILDARKEFATSAAENLEKLETSLPALIAADSFMTVEANATGSVDYCGVAVGFPEEGQSDFGLADEVDPDDLESTAEELGEASDEAKEAQDAVDAALERGWHADCVDDPMCLRSRAADLAGLSGTANPGYAHPEGWNFGVALQRARAYYRARYARETPHDGSDDERAGSAMRKVFYAYALNELDGGYYREGADGSVDVYLPRLARKPDEIRETPVYYNVGWPCTQEGDKRVIHAFSGCSGATGPSAGSCTLAQMENGAAEECEHCHLNPTQMGLVPFASTNIDNGFEYYWRIIQEASEEWERAKGELAAAEEAMREAGESGADLFDEALKALAVPRPKLCPPGAWGCVAVVCHGEAASPASLASAFTGDAELPAGAAMAAATLAPDDATAENNILARFFDSVSQGQDGGIEGILQGITGIWGRLLVAYGSASESLGGAARSLFDGLDSIGLGFVADWLSEKLTSAVEALGFQPADLRIKKPVLCNTQDVLDKEGSGSSADIRRYLQAMPADGDVGELLAAFGREYVNDLRDVKFTIAELPIPGTEIKIPLTVSLGQLGVL